jgi:uncharacterized protein YggE
MRPPDRFNPRYEVDMGIPHRNLRHSAVVPIVATILACQPSMAAPPAPLMTPHPNAPATDTTRLTVSASADVRVPADRVRLRFAVETEAATADAAARQNGETMNAVLERVRSVLGSGDRVETSGYRLMPRYPPQPQRNEAPEISGYRAQNEVIVVLMDVESVGTVLDAALEAGANRVAELSFFASDVEEARLEALREATARARREAEVIATSLGMTLGSPLEVQSSGGPRPVPMSLMRAEGASMDTPVESGSQAVSASVTITYRLVQGRSP